MGWYRYDFSKTTDFLVIGFGSDRMFNRKPNKGFEWDNLLKYKFGHLNFNTLFVGDVNNSWWHTNYEGLDGYGPHTLVNFLNEKIKECGATKTLYLGVSMGGYGAILFGCLTNATQVMSFSPQTYLTKQRYRKAKLYKKFANYDIDESLTDLKIVLEENPNNTIYKIWYGDFNKGDKHAASRISHIENVYTYGIESSNHPVIQPVIKSGEFEKEFYSFLDYKRDT